MYSFTINVRRRHLALAVVMLLVGVWVTHTDPADAGTDPPGEGIAVVYVAVGTGFADALGVGPGAGLNGAPVILVPTNPPLDPDTSAELIRLDPKAVIIIGGTAAVSDSMESTLVALLPNAEVSRIAGSNRYKTNAAFSAATFPIEGWVSVNATAFAGGEHLVDDAFATISQAFNATSGSLWAPIDLPHGATIVELAAAVQDANNSGAIVVSLLRMANNGLMEEVAIAATSIEFDSGLALISSTAIGSGTHVVDNEHYSYGIAVTGAVGIVFIRHARVRYLLGSSTG